MVGEENKMALALNAVILLFLFSPGRLADVSSPEHVTWTTGGGHGGGAAMEYAGTTCDFVPSRRAEQRGWAVMGQAPNSSAHDQAARLRRLASKFVCFLKL
jgi:hypothetical protein